MECSGTEKKNYDLKLKVDSQKSLVDSTSLLWTKTMDN